jgi:iron-sulfur cluster repair protein YtfE (RIC family)
MTDTAPPTLETTVNDLLRRDPTLVTLLARLGIDACCGGPKTLEQAAATAGLAPETVLEAVRKALA